MHDETAGENTLLFHESRDGGFDCRWIVDSQFSILKNDGEVKARTFTVDGVFFSTLQRKIIKLRVALMKNEKDVPANSTWPSEIFAIEKTVF